MPHEELRQRWHSLLDACGVHHSFAQADNTELINAYSERHRFYHSPAHLHHVLTTLDGLMALADNPSAVRLAAWFHDVVYDPRAGDNEERSADWAMRVGRRWALTQPLIDETARLVLLTKSHCTGLDDTNGCVLLDADLAILGASAEDYSRYADAIRREYDWVPIEEYRRGRRTVLEAFLDRDFLYFTKDCRDRLEDQAKSNLRDELRRLR